MCITPAFDSLRFRRSASLTVSQLTLVVLIHCFAAPAFALWSTNPAINNDVCTWAGTQTGVKAASDGAGGIIMVWIDYRSSIPGDIYAQRINSSGTPQWTIDGTPICVDSNNQAELRIISDGSGGAIIAWHDERGTYMQRVNGSGQVQWALNGVQLFAGSAPGFQMIEDGSGGAIGTWEDYRNGYYNSDIYARAISGGGRATMVRFWYSAVHLYR